MQSYIAFSCFTTGWRDLRKTRKPQIHLISGRRDNSSIETTVPHRIHSYVTLPKACGFAIQLCLIESKFILYSVRFCRLYEMYREIRQWKKKWAKPALKQQGYPP